MLFFFGGDSGIPRSWIIIIPGTYHIYIYLPYTPNGTIYSPNGFHIINSCQQVPMGTRCEVWVGSCSAPQARPMVLAHLKVTCSSWFSCNVGENCLNNGGNVVCIYIIIYTYMRVCVYVCHYNIILYHYIKWIINESLVIISQSLYLCVCVKSSI
jgi:hypothetical protein